MFTHHCTACERTQLIFPSQGVAATRGVDGIDFTFACWCGAEQSALIPDVEPIRDQDLALIA